MMIKRFYDVRFPGDWEWNFVGSRWNLRIARTQLALWRDFKPLLDWRRQ